MKALFTLGIICGLIYGGVLAKQKFFTNTPPAVSQSLICGSFSAPLAIIGIPTVISVGSAGTTIKYTDSYIVNVKNVPSMFLDRLSVVKIQEGQLVSFELLSRKGFDIAQDPTITAVDKCQQLAGLVPATTAPVAPTTSGN